MRLGILSGLYMYIHITLSCPWAPSKSLSVCYLEDSIVVLFEDIADPILLLQKQEYLSPKSYRQNVTTQLW